MDLFKFNGQIKRFNTLKEGLRHINISGNDLIFTSQRVSDKHLHDLYDCHILCHDNYGLGEPSDKKIDAINLDLRNISFQRMIAIGGGSVLDIAKILALKGNHQTIDFFQNKVPIENQHPIIAIPTTCGTGSEVTSISIAFIESLKTKMGLNHPALYPETALLIPELLDDIPYDIYMFSAIDALIHGIEAFLSPNSTIYTDLYAEKAIEKILITFNTLSGDTSNRQLLNVSEVLMASNLAGLAFGNSGVGAVHALSYPLGGKYHVPHGESNYLFLNDVLMTYKKINPMGKITSLEMVISDALNCSIHESLKKLDELLSQLIEKQPLKSYGMNSQEISSFSTLVIETQQRLLKNNYAELSVTDLEKIYKNLF
ncbi:MAG TPA: iron-containing alcohol dehydrogenase [Clostridia bacterium]|nr:iron-containing alcohol dehydrogenase [Clostridia bacterium]